MSNKEVEVIVTATPAVIKFDFVALKAQLVEGLKQYEIEVTTANLAEAKKMATELNKLSTTLNNERKEKVKIASEPIKEFEAQIKELVDLAQDGRQKILSQVQVFEDKVRAVCRNELDMYKEQLYAELGVRAEYQTVDIEPYVLLGSLTDNMKLTKKAQESVELAVQHCLALQNEIDLRVTVVEAESLKAGLKIALRLEDLPFKNAAKQEFDSSLAQAIARELVKQKQIEEQAKQRAIEEEQAKIRAEEQAKAQAEARAQMEAQMAEQAKQRAEAEAQQKAQAQTAPQPQKVEAKAEAVDGKVTRTIYAQFDIVVPQNYTGDLVAQVQKRLEDAKFTSLQKVWEE